MHTESHNDISPLASMFFHKGGARKIHTIRPLSSGERAALHAMLKGATNDKVWCDTNANSRVYSAAVPTNNIGAWAAHIEQVFGQLVNVRIVPEKEYPMFSATQQRSGRYRLRVYFKKEQEKGHYTIKEITR